MIFTPTRLNGAFVIELRTIEDERGFFARSWCQREFIEHKLDARLVQCNISYNAKKGTLRGMHYQLPPCAEAKLVRCTRGAIYDVVIDLRPSSATFLQWYAAELSAENRKAMYVPEGFAHGFQTLQDDSEVFYQMSEFYAPEYAGGMRWNDPQFNIIWPLTVSAISPRDQAYPDCDPTQISAFPVKAR